MKRYILVLIITASTLLFNFCKQSPTTNKLNEGLIKYDIEYLDDSLQEFMTTFLPKKMIISFKDNNTINKIEGLSGIISFSHIQNSKQGENITLVKVLHNKYKYIEKIGKPSIFFNELPNIEITKTNETKKIAGYNCTKARIYCSDSNIKPFNIYYTNDIKINKPNAHTPFHNIEGVMLQFEIKLYGIKMKLTASEIIHTKVSDDEFIISDEYKQINKNTMKEIISLLK